MTESKRPALLGRFYHDRDYQFWLFQFIGWSGLSLVSFFSLNLWYNQPEWSYVGHNIVQSFLGALAAWPLRLIFQRIWNRPGIERVVQAISAILLFSLLWTVIRLVAFMGMTGERGLWPDFGGWLFPSIFVFASWSALYHGIKYYRLLQEEHAMLLKAAAANEEEKLKRAQAESVAREAQLIMLRYQLNPHFLFNTLNAVSSLVEAGQPAVANRMIVRLSHFLRYSLYTDPSKMVSLDQEVEALELYLKIEQTRFGERLDIDIDVPKSVARSRIPSLLLQPLVENSIKYAVAPYEEGGRISICCEKQDECLVIVVSDTGPGVDWAQGEIPSGKGVGLSNTRDRLEALYGRDYQLLMSNREPRGLRLELRLPFDEPVAVALSRKSEKLSGATNNG